ncbi:hypothetical protein BDD43_1302 [Mucilaginibacter gracilis]|uniref:Uncharacterized protein n=1 Tax=Mucilaginibacter gracilis TaxID=423350 RepID=A0A495IYL4_9SPHI|nr:hypothetical protein [Mucilaginibacter gracilis]RKR81158.1 hypothetical protein BDD43_1302 [Mucilaginibacter gracilis]
MDLKHHIANENHILSETQLEGINAGLADIEAGRTHSNEYVNTQIEQMIYNFRNGSDNSQVLV